MNDFTNIMLNLVIFGFLIFIEVIIPKLTRKDIVFSIRVPIEELKNKKIKKIGTDYKKNIIFKTLPIAMVVSLFVSGETDPFIYKKKRKVHYFSGGMDSVV